MNFKRTMLKTVAATVFSCIAMGSAMAADITGAGATFLSPSIPNGLKPTKPLPAPA